MNVKRILVGPLQANCYILTIEKDNIIIDPGSEADKIKNSIKGKVICILITHHHDDHTGALEEIKETFNCPIYDFSNLQEQKYQINNFYFEVIYTKGHTDDSITYYFYKDKIMFTGDFLFKGTIGRTDLETGNVIEMQKSINKIKTYHDIKIYPGHGEETTINDEKQNNIYLGSGIWI